ncbi:hypothetical protein [Agarivorans litoreus]|uniref:hypothetical protein n=1 Tax=Agarivorans litoreus TaxID=1510455 RepID=UPI001C7CCBAD|nr:hypothetical protein [Agarivorans litoreus]
MNNSAPLSVALKHGDIKQLFDNIYFVTGTVTMTKPLSMSFSRNMCIVKQGSQLVLINSVQLSPAGLSQLDMLGKVSDVIRLAAFHGMDDPFYKHHYGAKVWSVDAPYNSELSRVAKQENIYFEPDHILSTQQTKLPINDAKYIEISSAEPKESLILLPQNKGVLIAGDSLQNWQTADSYFNFAGAVLMKMMGFLKAYNVGPGWLKMAKPEKNEIKSLLELDFEHVIPAHGSPVIKNAKQHFSGAITRL